MGTIKVSKTVYPDNKPKSFNEWSMFILSQLKADIKPKKNGWEQNIYIPKKSN